MLIMTYYSNYSIIVGNYIKKLKYKRKCVKVGKKLFFRVFTSKFFFYFVTHSKLILNQCK